MNQTQQSTLEQLKKEAEEGNVDSMFEYAQKYRDGKGVMINKSSKGETRLTVR